MRRCRHSHHCLPEMSLAVFLSDAVLLLLMLGTLVFISCERERERGREVRWGEVRWGEGRERERERREGGEGEGQEERE